MAIRLPNPPRGTVKLEDWVNWFENLWNWARGLVRTTGDVAATVGSGTTYHGVTALTAARTLTLPEANLLQDGDVIVFQDESGAAATYNITIQRSGTDTINGGNSVSITTNYGRRVIIKRGSGKYYSA